MLHGCHACYMFKLFKKIYRITYKSPSWTKISIYTENCVNFYNILNNQAPSCLDDLIAPLCYQTTGLTCGL